MKSILQLFFYVMLLSINAKATTDHPISSFQIANSEFKKTISASSSIRTFWTLLFYDIYNYESYGSVNYLKSKFQFSVDRPEDLAEKKYFEIAYFDNYVINSDEVAALITEYDYYTTYVLIKALHEKAVKGNLGIENGKVGFEFTIKVNDENNKKENFYLYCSTTGTSLIDDYYKNQPCNIRVAYTCYTSDRSFSFKSSFEPYGCN